MTQTTNQMSMKNAKIEQSTNGTVWTDASGIANAVEWDGGERATGEEYTFDGDTPVQTVGKRGMLTVTVRALYTEGASDPAAVAQTAYEAGTPLYYRWSPKGGLSGQKQYTTAAGVVKKPVFPAGEAKSADPILVEIALEMPSITVSTIV